MRIPVGKGFAGRIAAEREPIVLPDVDHADVLNPILREKGIKSLLGVPLLVRGERARRDPRRDAHAADVHARTTPSCSSSPPSASAIAVERRSCTSELMRLDQLSRTSSRSHRTSSARLRPRCTAPR